jgi:hypothetical protein
LRLGTKRHLDLKTAVHHTQLVVILCMMIRKPAVVVDKVQLRCLCQE